MSVQPVPVGADGDIADPAAAASLADLPAAQRSRLHASLHGVLQTPSAAVGLCVVLFWVLCAIFWPLVVPYNPNAQDAAALLARPSAAHPFGTDHLGRDVLSRVLAGSREVLLLAPAATLIGLIGGIAVGSPPPTTAAGTTRC